MIRVQAHDDDRAARMAQRFGELYGATPELWLRAPGRVDLMGSHTDYNLGYVLTLPINRDTWIAARRRTDGVVRLHSANLPGGSTFASDEVTHEDETPWANYVRGVAWALAERGYPVHGWDGLVESTIPIGSGLSSSAALECAAAAIFTALAGQPLDPVETALICQRAENRFVGVNCGILDQYTSMMGRAGCALLLDCRDLSSRPVSIPEDVTVVICDTRYRRTLAGSEYGARRAACEEGARLLSAYYPEVQALRDVTPAMLAALAAHGAALPGEVALRSRFIVEENARVKALAEALPRGDRPSIREITLASFAGARDLYEISVPQMEAMHAAMMAAPGAIGARQAGAGFGGCMVAFVDTAQVIAFAGAVRADYATRTGITAEVYPVQAADGAGPVATPAS
jgi:galactokinase